MSPSGDRGEYTPPPSRLSFRSLPNASGGLDAGGGVSGQGGTDANQGYRNRKGANPCSRREAQREW